jgi:hypothetical protein
MELSFFEYSEFKIRGIVKSLGEVEEGISYFGRRNVISEAPDIINYDAIQIEISCRQCVRVASTA